MVVPRTPVTSCYGSGVAPRGNDVELVFTAVCRSRGRLPDEVAVAKAGRRREGGEREMPHANLSQTQAGAWY